MSEFKALEAKISHLFAIQHEQNVIIHPKWEDQGYAYPDAMFTEAVELYNYTNWEWWKNLNRPVKMEQAQVEVVDILMFLLSEVKSKSFGNPVSMMLPYDSTMPALLSATPGVNLDALKVATKKFIIATLEHDLHGRSKDGLTLHRMVGRFWQLVVAAGMTFDELFAKYIVKVELNKLRWVNGYKKAVWESGPYTMGTYIKTWTMPKLGFSAPGSMNDDAEEVLVEDNEWVSAYAKIVNWNHEKAIETLREAIHSKYQCEVEQKVLEANRKAHQEAALTELSNESQAQGRYDEEPVVALTKG